MPSLGELRMYECRAVPSYVGGARSAGFCIEYKASVYRGVVEASECSRADFLPELFGGVSEGVHA